MFQTKEINFKKLFEVNGEHVNSGNVQMARAAVDPHRQQGRSVQNDQL
jgi:hypothetical protein